ncbi:Transcription termination factor MTERF6, chloroplastic/mitochondrial isoform B, partial [Glycine soja]
DMEGDGCNVKMLVKIHTNWFAPFAFPVRLAHKIEGCFELSKYVLFTRPPISSSFEVDNDKARKRRSSWRCGCGSEEARRAVSSYLGELGVSEEDSVWISSKSPEYVKMLVEGVRDLEQWQIALAGLSFKDKILHIAAQKGDKGKVAYLESLGFTLSSSMNIARYLPSDTHTLPSLMHKVTRIKQLLFFSPTPDHHLLIKSIRLMMRHLSISIDEDLQHTLSFFEKLQAKPGGLGILAYKNAAFRSLIESFPRLLQLSVDNHFTPILHFLHNFGIPTFRISNIILAFPPLLFWDLQLLQTRLLVFKEIDLPDKDYAKLLLKYPWLLSTSIQENYTELLAFSYSIKVPKTQIDRAIESHPHLLSCSTSKLKSMVDQFAELGVRNKKLNQVIAKSPQLLLRKPKDFLQIIIFGNFPFKSLAHCCVQIVLLFENMGFDKETIGRILARCPEIFAASINKTLQRKIEFLGRVGVSKTFLPGVIRKYPELLVSDIDKTLLQRIMYLMKLGLSEKDIAYMVRTFSPLLGYSIEGVLRPKIEFLVNSMERPVRDVVDYPRYFSYSLEKKIKPRYWVLKGRDIKCSLKDMLGKNDEEFAAEFMGIGRMLVYPPVSSNDSQ